MYIQSVPVAKGRVQGASLWDSRVRVKGWCVGWRWTTNHCWGYHKTKHLETLKGHRSEASWALLRRSRIHISAANMDYLRISHPLSATPSILSWTRREVGVTCCKKAAVDGVDRVWVCWRVWPETKNIYKSLQEFPTSKALYVTEFLET